MGEIRKDNLHESLIEELNELANIDLSGYQEKTDENLITESKDLVGAINELFQSANNGKELIANAIGEPVSKDDTFQAMINDINGLLSTFKTNMMNNGITVESGDKFKQLIDKIATMVEEGSGKGIQYAESAVSINCSGTTTITTGLDFTPNLVFVSGSITGKAQPTSAKTMTHSGLTFSNLATGHIKASNTNGNIYHAVSISNITQESFNVTITNASATGSFAITNWYAIGVGEEDTTLLDSLKSILAEEGVTTTEEDDMASLISKVSELVKPVGDAIASNVVSGKTFINSTGEVITGTMPTRGGGTVTPTTTNQTLPTGHYSSEITIAGDADLVPANIVSGKNIFGVTGTASIASMGGVKIIPGTEFTFATDKKNVGNVKQTSDFVECLSYTVQFTGSYTVDLYTFTSSSSTYMQCRITVKSSSGTVKSEKTSGDKNNSKVHFTHDFAVNKGDVIIFSYKVISGQINLNNFIYTVSGYLQD